jgi:hypothetical protein
VGPVRKAQVRRLLILGVKFLFDDGQGTQEQVAGVGHDGGAPRRDLVAGLLSKELAEAEVDGNSRAKFLGVTDEFVGLVGLVEFFLVLSGVRGAEAGVAI